jgi:uncharacterized protein
MPNINQLIKTEAINRKVLQYIVEKDYALSYLLAAIAKTLEFEETLVLKGGTALKKLYFDQYRFSEDLDFSTRIIGQISNIDSIIQKSVEIMFSALNERGPFQVNYQPLILQQNHPGDQKAFIIRVQFPEQRQALCRLKVEITIDEPILLPIETHPILHGFSEDLDAKVFAYSLIEITAEKLRALLQSKARLQARGWGASRVCRDYYDLWNLLRQPEVNTYDFLPLLQEKCKLRNVSFNSPLDFVSEELMNIAKTKWEQQLLPFVPDAPNVEKCLSEVKGEIISILC